MYIAGEIREIINSVLIVVTGIALLIKYVHIYYVYSLFSTVIWLDKKKGDGEMRKIFQRKILSTSLVSL